MNWVGAIACLLIGGFVAPPAGAAGDSLARRNPSSAEPLARVETTIGEIVVGQGLRLRIFATRPEGSSRRLPAVYFVQWLSCDSVEIGQVEDGWTGMLRSLVQDSGMVVLRLEKAGVGDSEGGPCHELDYDTELAHHRQALLSLLEHPWVDRERVFVFGASMGSNLAPLLASGQALRGVAVWGGGARTWLERQLGFERRALELGGATGAQIDDRMRRLSRIYAAVLLERRRPEEIEVQDPGLAADWKLATGSTGASQFGRPIAFHQQAQAQHWAAAWESVDAPVLALFGEYDWFDEPAAVELIGTVVNRRHPGRAQVRILAGIDHHFTRYRSPAEAFAGSGGTPDAAAVMQVLLPWLRQHAD